MIGASSGGCLDNAGLREKYEQMHAKGPSAWFDDGSLERDLVLRMGEPWAGEAVLEIGAGEGDLCMMMSEAGASVLGVDYSEYASRAAMMKGRYVLCSDYRRLNGGRYTRLVLQGVLEHLDDPFAELQWMIDHFNPKTIITSSPGFLNPRGIVWMTLHMLGAVMSKTDLHCLHPWQFEQFCKERGYRLQFDSCDIAWGFGEKMAEDLKQRIPLALKDGAIPYRPEALESFLEWLENASYGLSSRKLNGAVICYRIDL